MAKRTCSIEGCEKQARTIGLCPMHYTRVRRHKTPGPAEPIQLTFPENLLRSSSPQPNGCVWYMGALDDDGYGRIKCMGKMKYAHRAAYEHFVGPIPEGLVIDHECHNADETCAGGTTCLHRRCVNPEHLAVVTVTVNSLSGRGVPAVNARKTHCKRGHEFTPENTMTVPGGRQCRQCTRLAPWNRKAS